MSARRPGEHDLLDLVVTEVRGPRRNSLFAGWLLLRICLDLTGPVSISARNHRLRLAALRKRLGTLTLPPPLRRTMQDIIEQLTEHGPTAVETSLERLADGLRHSVDDRAAQTVRATMNPARAALESTNDVPPR